MVHVIQFPYGDRWIVQKYYSPLPSGWNSGLNKHCGWYSLSHAQVTEGRKDNY